MNMPRDAYPGYSEDVPLRPRVNWKHAYIGMEAARKRSEETIDALVAALEGVVDHYAARTTFGTLVAADEQYPQIAKAMAALALAHGEK